MGLSNPSRETKFSGANGDKEYFIFPVQLADREQDWQPCPVVMVMHINKLYTHTAVVTHVYIYAYTAVNRARMCMSPNKKYTDTWYTNQYKQQYCTSTYIYVLIPGYTADHEQVWQPYAVDPYYSAISK